MIDLPSIRPHSTQISCYRQAWKQRAPGLFGDMYAFLTKQFSITYEKSVIHLTVTGSCCTMVFSEMIEGNRNQGLYALSKLSNH